jgi:hypothetical protein
VCTNRGADINTLINIIERRDFSVYKTIIIHIGGRLEVSVCLLTVLMSSVCDEEFTY